MKLANAGFLEEDFSIVAPFVDITKTDIAELAILLNLPLEKTYSDYEGGEIQNAMSGTSVERIEAIAVAYQRIHKLEAPFTSHHKSDPTEYTNKEYALNLLIEGERRSRLSIILNRIDSKNLINFRVI